MKKLIGIILILSVVLSFTVISASAAENNSNSNGNIASNSEIIPSQEKNSNRNIAFNGVIFPSPSQEKNYSQNLTKEELKKINEKINAADKLASQPTTRVAPYKISMPGSFYMYQQENGYYCVPASVKSVLRYNSCSILSQSSIAKSLGTTSSGTYSSEIAPYLNSKQSFYYVRSTPPNQSTMSSYLYCTIAQYKYPSIMLIVNPTGANWHYKTNGHCLVVNAIYNDKSKIQFADPLGATQSGWPGFYEKNASEVIKVCREIIW